MNELVEEQVNDDLEALIDSTHDENTPSSSGVKFNDRKREVILPNGKVIHDYHSSKECRDSLCPVHNPSEHKYRDLELDYIEGLFVRLTKKSRYGFIPDPDDPWARKNTRIILRNSLYCRNCETEIVSQHLNDYQKCQCDMGTFVSVNGGKEYLRRVLSYDGLYEDTSIVFLPRTKA